MIRIHQFESALSSLLPETYALLASSNLVVHPRVSRITLHGSRGPAGGYRPNSDIDLSLIVSTDEPREIASLRGLLQRVLETTLGNWRGPTELDLAAVFDTMDCGLRCFDLATQDDRLCAIGGGDCFGVYKTQKGFHGFVSGAAVQVERIHPCLTIWRNEARSVSL